MLDYTDIATLGIATGLGLLVGLQRQYTDNEVAGIRTFTFITLLGTIIGFMTRDTGNVWLLPSFGIIIGAFLVTSNIIRMKTGDFGIGQTTEIAALLMFVVGSYLVLGDRLIGVVMGGGVAVALHAKERLHNVIDRFSDKDIAAIMTFAAIAMVILPILPDKTYGPLDVLNPRNIWFIVVLIVGISVAGYFLYKFIGKKAGVISNGILGGLISSTATTVSYSRLTKQNEGITLMAAFVITAASMISFVRVLIEVGVVIPQKLPAMVVPIALVVLFMIVLCVILFLKISNKGNQEEIPEPENPAQFKSALIFGLLYGLILLAVAFSKEELGNEALFIVSIISGLTDVDAITLSLSRLISQGNLDTHYGWQLILLAGLSNLLFKGIMSGVLGTRRLFKWVGFFFGMTIAFGLLLMWLWPEGWQLSQWF